MPTAVLTLLPALLALPVYWATLPPGLTWRHGGADGGELATAAYVLGVAHPTGYPLWVALAHLFLSLPLPGSVAFRLSLFSALTAAAACALLAAALLAVLPRQLPPLVRALAAGIPPAVLAVAPAFWQQAIIIEVYALHFLLLAGLLFTFARLRERPGADRAAAFGAVAGLTLAHHVTAALLFPGLAAALWLDRRRFSKLGWRGAAWGLAAMTPGLALYGLLPLWAERQAVMNWGDPRTLDNFLAHVTGAAYQSYLRDMPLLAALARVPVAARLLLDQIGWPGFLLAVWGLWEWAVDREDRPLAMLVVAGSAGVMAHALHYNARDSQVYLVPSYLLLTLALGRGIAAALTLMQDAAPNLRAKRWAMPLAAAALAAWPLVAAGLRWPELDLSADREAVEWTAATLAALPQHAVFVTDDDDVTFALWYAQIVEGQRPDVLTLDYRLLLRPWYLENLRRLHPELPWPQASLPLTDIPAFFRTATGSTPRPVYYRFAVQGLSLVREGALYRVE